MACIRKRPNTILKVKDIRGNWFEGQEEILQLITKEFQKRFKVEETTTPLQAIALSRNITETDNEFLTNEVIEEEIFEVVKHINPMKALGPDGTQAIFHQKNQNIVGKPVNNMVRSFFNSSPLLKEINRADITLVSKIGHPDSVSHYRSVSLRNIPYKIISKTLVNRLQAVFSKDLSRCRERSFNIGIFKIIFMSLIKFLIPLQRRGMDKESWLLNQI